MKEEIEILKKENTELIQEVAALKKIFLITLIYNTNDSNQNIVDYYDKIIQGYFKHKDFANRNTLIDQPNWIVNKKIEAFLLKINQLNQNHQSQENPQQS